MASLPDTERRPAPTGTVSAWALDAVACALLVVCVLAVYAQAAGHHFLLNWDDGSYVVDNPAAHGLTLDNVAAAFSGVFVGNYAPLHILSYMLDYRVFGLFPGGYALENALLHGLNSALLYWVLVRLLRDRLAALLAAALFAFHPAQVESVAWISQRKNVLSMSFFLTALLLFTSYRAGRRPVLSYLGALLAFGLSLLVKSAAVVLPAVLLLLEVGAPAKRSARRIALELAPFAVVAAAGGALAYLSQRPESPTGRLPYLGGSPAASLFTMSTVLVRYLGLLAFPSHLSAAYAPPFRASIDGAVAASLALLAALAVSLFLLWRRRPALAAWAGVFVVGLLPVLQVVPLVTLMNDRYLYYPMLGAAPLLVLLVVPPTERRGPWRKVAAAALVLVAVGLAWLSYRRVPVWRDDVALFSDAVREVPRSASTWFSLASALEDGGLEVPSSLAYVKVLSLDPDYALARIEPRRGAAVVRAAGDRERDALHRQPGRGPRPPRDRELLPRRHRPRRRCLQAGIPARAFPGGMALPRALGVRGRPLLGGAPRLRAGE